VQEQEEQELLEREFELQKELKDHIQKAQLNLYHEKFTIDSQLEADAQLDELVDNNRAMEGVVNKQAEEYERGLRDIDELSVNLSRARSQKSHV